MTGGDERPLARFSRGLLMFQLVVVAGTLCFPTLAGTIQLDTKSRDKPRELVRHAEKAIWGVFGDLSVPNQSLPGENRTIACYRDRVCAMENKHGLTASIPVHEGMMPLCGDGHWTVLANLGK